MAPSIEGRQVAEILEEIHTGISGGHLGMIKMLKMLDNGSTGSFANKTLSTDVGNVLFVPPAMGDKNVRTSLVARLRVSSSIWQTFFQRAKLEINTSWWMG